MIACFWASVYYSDFQITTGTIALLDRGGYNDSGRVDTGFP
jgi:hypothetical protein